MKLLDFIKEIEINLLQKAKIKYLPLQSGDVVDTRCDTNKIKECINFIPSVNYKIGIKKFIQWYKTYYK